MFSSSIFFDFKGAFYFKTLVAVKPTASRCCLDGLQLLLLSSLCVPTQTW